MEKLVNQLKNSKDQYNFIDKIELNELERLYEYTNEKYRNEKSVINDSLYDMIEDFLKLKFPKSKLLKKIGAKVKSKNKVELPYHLGSMDKIKPPSNKLNGWKNKYLSENTTIVWSEKLDGVSALLVYDNNKIKLYTRGTAIEGTDISNLIKYLNLPNFEDIKKYVNTNNLNGKNTMIAFRGELVIPINVFNKKWKSTKKNARNTVSGLVNSKTVNPELANDTKLVLYEVVDPNLTILEQFKIIKDTKLNCVHFKIVENKKFLTYDYLSKYLVKRKIKSKYEIDGIIVTTNDLHKRNTKGNPEYAFAFKDILEDQKAKSRVINIEWNKSKDGYIKPTIIIEPVEVGGVTIQRVTGNNAKFIKDNGINIGTELEIIRSGDVIPKVNKIIKNSEKHSLPKGEWEWNETNVDIICKNTKCSEVLIKNIHFFFAVLDTKGLGLKIVEKLYNNGFDTVLKILIMKKEDLLEIEGIKEKSANNLVKSIKLSLTNKPLELFMKASNKLGHGMGEERVKTVLKKYPNLIDEYSKWEEDEFINKLKAIDGWQDKTSRMFVKNFSKFIDFYNSIKKYITVKTPEKTTKTGKYFNKKIVMSGFRNKILKDYLEKEGAIISNSLSSNTDILIIKDNTIIDTGKVKKAKELEIEIKTQNYFFPFLT